MAELTEVQKAQMAADIKAAQAQLKANNTIQVIVTGSGAVASSNPRFQIEKKED